MAHVSVVNPGGEVEEFLVEEVEGINVKDEVYAGAVPMLGGLYDDRDYSHRWMHVRKISRESSWSIIWVKIGGERRREVR